MTLTRWLFDSALASTLVLLVGAAAMAWVRQPARRQRLGEWTLLGCLLIAGISALPGLPRLSLGLIDPPALRPIAAGPAVGIEIAARQSSPTPRALAEPAGRSDATLPGLWQSLAIHWTTLAASAYGLLAAGALVRVLAGHLQLWRLARAAQQPPRWLCDLWLPLAAGLPRRVQLRLSARVSRPICFGLGRPVVLLPARLARVERADDLRILLAHELVHIRRRDALTWLIAAAAQVLFFYQPLYWYLRRQLRLAQEFIADAWAAEHAHSPLSYAEKLLQLAREDLRPAPAYATAAVRGPSEFFRRMQRLLADTPTEKCCSARWSAAAASLVLLLAAGAASLTLQARTPEDPGALAERRALRYLLAQQQPSGGWLPQYGPAPTALVLRSLLQSGMTPEQVPVRRARTFLEAFRQDDGGYYSDTEPTYNTAIVLSVLTLLPGNEERIATGQRFLTSAQRPAAAGRGWYARKAAAAPPRWMDPAERSAEAVLDTYGALTYANLKSFAYAALNQQDARVRRSAAWLQRNWTLTNNPGLNSPDGLFYYYHLAAKTLRAANLAEVQDRQGRVHDWRAELRTQLAATQRRDGSWINADSNRWLEDQRVLVTAYGVLALQEIRK